MSTMYSPIDCLPRASLTGAGLLQKEEGEVELFTRNDIQLRTEELLPPLSDNHQLLVSITDSQWNDRTEHLRLLITTHRIVFFPQARFLPHSHTLQGVPQGKLLFQSPKIVLTTYTGVFLIVFRHTQDRDDALTHIQSALSRKLYQLSQSKPPKVRSGVGMDAILRKSAAQQEHATKLTNTAFTDPETFLQEATDLVKMIQKYVATLDKHNESNNNDDQKQLAGMLRDMGMTSSLTTKKEYAGDSLQYYEQLARELADFIRPKVKDGIMTLTDVYCVYNRARGSNLLSPDDLSKAVDLLPKLNVGVTKRVFTSGLIVIQDASVDELEIFERLKVESGVSTVQAAKLLGVSALLAQEQLAAAEALGYLARDETLESIRYYPNRFEEWL